MRFDFVKVSVDPGPVLLEYLQVTVMFVWFVRHQLVVFSTCHLLAVVSSQNISASATSQQPNEESHTTYKNGVWLEY
jgi:hypothetical protein